MRRAPLIAALLLAAAGARAGGDGERVVDVRALPRPAAERRSPELGLSRAGSPTCSWWLEAVDPAPAVNMERLRSLLLAEPGPAAAEAEILGDGLLAVRGGEAEAALASLFQDATRTVRVGAVLTLSGGTRVTADVSARPGRWASAGATRVRRLLADADVEIACDNPYYGIMPVIADPIVEAISDGYAVDVRPYLVDGGRRAAIEAVVQAGGIVEPEECFRLDARSHGSLDLPRYRGAFLVVSCAGAADFRIAGPDGTMEVCLTPEVLGESGSGPARLLDAGTVGLGRDGLTRYDDSDDDVSAREWARLRAHSEGRFPVKPPVGAGLAPDDFGACAVTGTPETIAAAEATIDALSALAARTVLVDLTLCAGDETIVSASFPVLDGREALIRAGEERMIVADWDVEVGCSAQIGDPITIPVFSGLLVNARPRVSPDGGTVLLDVAIRLQNLDGEPEVRPSGQVVAGAIHLPRLVTRETEASLCLPAGGSARLALGRLPDGRPLEAEVRIREIRVR